MRSLPLLVALAAVAAPAGAETYVVDNGHSEVSFQVRHLVSKVRGGFGSYAGTFQLDRQKPEASKVEFTIQSASINTALPDRDKHLKGPDFFDAEKYPAIRFESAKIVAKGKDAYEVTGPLTMRGVTKTVTLPVSFLGFVKDPWGNEKAGFETTVVLNRKDYGMVWNAALDKGGFVLGDDVTVSINLELARKAPEKTASK